MKKTKSLKLRDVKPAKDPKGGKFHPRHRTDDGGTTGGPGTGVPRKQRP